MQRLFLGLAIAGFALLAPCGRWRATRNWPSRLPPT